MDQNNQHADAALPEKPACLVCRDRPAEIRGQCRRCRQGTSRAVAAGYTTEQALLEKGLIRPRRSGPRVPGTFEWRRKLAELQVSGENTPAAASSTKPGSPPASHTGTATSQSF